MVWSAAAGLVAVALGYRRAAPWIAAAVFSHFLLDVPMHTPDMPILGNDSTKIGFGLWRHVAILSPWNCSRWVSACGSGGMRRRSRRGRARARSAS